MSQRLVAAPLDERVEQLVADHAVADHDQDGTLVGAVAAVTDGIAAHGPTQHGRCCRSVARP